MNIFQKPLGIDCGVLSTSSSTKSVKLEPET